ncbi:MAG: hypothetical protein WAW52_12635 [Methanothrix sp.]
MMAAEVTARDVELIRLSEKIERLEAIINLYLHPLEEIFSEDDQLRASAQKVVTRHIEKDRDAIDSITDIKADIQDINSKLDHLMHKHKPGEITLRRLQKTDALLVARGNMQIPFAEMGKLQEFKPRYRDQDMTKLGRIYEEYPDRYEIRDSKLGGKTIKLTPSYYKHLTKGED